jgi:hypothetical protein
MSFTATKSSITRCYVSSELTQLVLSIDFSHLLVAYNGILPAYVRVVPNRAHPTDDTH